MCQSEIASLLERRDGGFAGDTGEVVQKLLQGRAGLEVVQKRLKWNPGPGNPAVVSLSFADREAPLPGCAVSARQPDGDLVKWFGEPIRGARDSPGPEP